MSFPTGYGNWEELARLHHALYPNSTPFVPNPDAWAEFQASEIEREQERAYKYGEQPREDFVPGQFQVAYAHARQRMGYDPLSAKAYAQAEADGRTHGDTPVPDPEWDRRWREARLSSLIPVSAPVQAGPIPTAETAESYRQPGFLLRSNGGRFAGLKTADPAAWAAISESNQPRAVDMSPEEWAGTRPMQAPRDSADQHALFAMQDQTGSGMYSGDPPGGVSIDEPDSLERPHDPAPVHNSPAPEPVAQNPAAPTGNEAEVIAKQAVERGAERVDPMAQATRSGRRLAGGLAVTGGLGLAGLLGLAALTDPYKAPVEVVQ